ERLEILDLDAVRSARVGDVIATLRLAGRQHALVVEMNDEDNAAAKTICGIFSLTQIARQLGIPQQQVHDIARTFAEIEAVIASSDSRARRRGAKRATTPVTPATPGNYHANDPGVARGIRSKSA